MGERELPEGWEWKRLGDAINYQKGKKPNLLEEVPHPTSLPYLSADFLRTAKSTQFIPENERNSCILANNQDILLIWDGSNSGEVFLGKEGVVSSTMAKIKPKTTNLLQQYLFYFLKTQFNILNDGTNGSSIPHVSKSLFENIRLLVPPLPVQRQIVAVLENAEVVKRQRKEADSLTGALLQSVFFEWFGDPERNERGWETKKLYDILSEDPQNGLYKPSSEYSDGGTPIVRIDSFYDGKIGDLRNLKRINCTEKEIAKYLIHEGDVLINRVNSLDFLGKCGLVQKIFENTIYECNMIRMRPNRTLVHPTYLTAFLCTQFVKNQILNRAKNAVNQASINQQDVKALNILIPPLDLQQQFARIVEDVVRIREQQGASGKEIEGLCEGLMQRAFAGELVMNEA